MQIDKNFLSICYAKIPIFLNIAPHIAFHYSFLVQDKYLFFRANEYLKKVNLIETHTNHVPQCIIYYIIKC